MSGNDTSFRDTNNSRLHFEKIPTVPFGDYQISRLLVGGNPVSGNSHYSEEMSRDMLHYFTSTNIKKMLSRCEEVGINTWQSRGDAHIRRLLVEYRDEGGHIQWIAQTASEFADFRQNVESIQAFGPIAIYHHGTRTDTFWENGQIDKVKDDLKILRDTGLRVGVGSHVPKVLEYMEEKDWDVDFYMTSFYNINQIAVGAETYLEKDREAMCQFIQQTPKQCIAFKILAAGRNTETPQDVENALKFAFDHIKPQDVIDVGMFPKYSDQVFENAKIVANLVKQS